MQDHFMRQDATVRVIRLLRLLQAIQGVQPSGRITIQRLRGHLDCSDATLHRDIGLLESEGFLERPNRGIYRLTSNGKQLASINLSSQDLFALAFIRSLVTEELLPICNLIQSVLDRAIGTLPQAIRERFQHAAAQVEPPAAGRDYRNAPWMLLLQACTEQLTVEMDYDSRSSGRRHRLLDPYRLTVEGNVWMVQGWCHKNQAIRSFALDKLHAAKRTGQTFVRNEAVWEAFKEEVGVFSGLRGGEPIAVRVRFSETVADYALKPGRWPTGLTATLEPDGTVLLIGTARGTEGIIPELLRWRRHAVVEGGPELHAAMVAEVTALWQHYQGDLLPPLQENF